MTTLAAPVALRRTTVGKKAVMAVTGLVLFGFVVAHMLGNLKIFTGREHFNAYAAFLRTMGAPILPREYALWGLRGILIVSVLLHIAMALLLSRQSYAARPVSYRVKKSVSSTYASRTMRWGGTILGLFVFYHLLHMTTGTLNNDFTEGDPYSNMVAAFSHWYIFAAYAVAILALGLHVFHGFWSMFQTLGRGSGRLGKPLRGLALLIAGGLAVGYLAGPAAVLAGRIS